MYRYVFCFLMTFHHYVYSCSVTDHLVQQLSPHLASDFPQWWATWATTGEVWYQRQLRWSQPLPHRIKEIQIMDIVIVIIIIMVAAVVETILYLKTLTPKTIGRILLPFLRNGMLQFHLHFLENWEDLSLRWERWVIGQSFFSFVSFSLEGLLDVALIIIMELSSFCFFSFQCLN